jgi:hypothetical protein
MDPSNQNNKVEDSSQQNNTGNMYTYNDEDNINNPNHLEGAIRRSMNEVIGNNNYPPQNDHYNPQFTDNNIKTNTNVQVIQNQTYYNDQNNSNNNNNSFVKWVPYLIFTIIEIIIIILIACLYTWDLRNDPYYSTINMIVKNETENEENENNSDIRDIHNLIKNATESEMKEYDGLFRDINVMVFIGFGMFHTLLKRYSWTSITISMMSIAFSFQIGLFTNLLWANAFNEKWISGTLNFDTFIRAIINSATVLVSTGCVLGKLTYSQHLIMIVLETIMCSLNFQLCDAKLKIVDLGALYIHVFGAFFGVSIYMVLFYTSKMKSKNLKENFFNKSDYISNLTSFIGILFLWCYFPSFNSGLVKNINARYRSSINTYLSLTGSVLGAFSFSSLLYKGRLLFEHILFGCFSGGVMISGCCSICLDHWAALLIGLLSGSLSVIFLFFIKPIFIKWNYFDIYNIIYIHGLPGLLGAFITPMVIGNINYRLNDDYHYLLNDIDRKNNLQAGIQVGAIFITLGLAFVSGISTGYLMKVAACGKVEKFFMDSEMFENEINIIDNLELNQFYYGDINRASLLQNKIEFSDRGSHISYN